MTSPKLETMSIKELRELRDRVDEALAAATNAVQTPSGVSVPAPETHKPIADQAAGASKATCLVNFHLPNQRTDLARPHSAIPATDARPS